MTVATKKKRGTDECRARGCGGLITGVGAFVYDGEIHACRRCGRHHTYHVPYENGGVVVEIHRKPRTASPRAGRGGEGT